MSSTPDDSGMLGYTASPIIAPDLSEQTVDAAVQATLVAAGPYLPAKARAAIYTTAGFIAAVAVPVGSVLGGTIGHILDGIGAAAAVAASVTALSHIQKALPDATTAP